MANDLEHIESELKELKNLLEQKTNGNGSLSSHIKGMQAFVYIMVILIGVGVNWGVSTSKLNSVQTSVSSLEQKLHNTDITLRALELKQAGDDRTLATLQLDITEIKQDLKKLIAKRGEQ